MINSRAKGANGEREFAQIIKAHFGVQLIRNLEQSRSGGFDLLVEGHSPTADYLRMFAIEIKRYKQASESDLTHWWSQSVKQAQKAELLPMLAYRLNRGTWRIVLSLAHVLELPQSQHPEISLTVAFSVDGYVEFVNSRLPLKISSARELAHIGDKVEQCADDYREVLAK